MTARNLRLFLVALAVRLLHLSLLRQAAPELVENPVLDAAHYHRWAQEILAGTGLSHRVFFMHPLYPHVLAALYAVTGPSPIAAVVFQSVLGALGVVVFHELAVIWLDRRTALVAAVMLALYRPLVTNAALLETVELGIFLMLVSLWLCATAGEPRAWLRLGASGVVFILACLCRGNLILAAPALLLAAPRPRASAAIAAGMVLMVLLVGARNRVVGGEWIWLTSSGGQTFYLGNYRGATSGAHEPPPFLRADPVHEEADYHAEAERRAGRPLNSGQTSRFWFGEAGKDLAAAPGAAVVRFARKLGLTVAAYEIADNYNLAYLAALTPLRWAPLPGFLTVIGFAALGIVLLWPRRRALILLYGTMALYVLSLGVFYVSSRLRIYLAPFLIAFAAHGAVWLFDNARNRRALVGLAVAAVMLVSASLVPARIRDVEQASALNSHALALLEDRRPAEAARLRTQALALDPDNEYLLVNNGLAALDDGDVARAADLCRRAAELRPMLATAHVCLGVALAHLRRFDEAEAAFRRAAAADQDGPESLYNLAVLLAGTGRHDEARVLYEQILDTHPDHQGARQGLEMTSASRRNAGRPAPAPPGSAP